MAETSTTPPMDEILASIRRIITDEPPLGAPVPESDDTEAEDQDVLELGEPNSVELPAAVPNAPPTVPPPTLVSQQTQDASQRALAALSGLNIDPDAGANTLDGLVREMIRPMLKDWLDAHLPELVERLVAREVARISGR
jgi:cell pole-organizing protein PopZ